MEKLLQLRKEKKKRNPVFLRTDARWKMRLPLGWRRPHGLHNKIRLQKKGYNPMVKPGYRTPAKVRGLTSKGKVPKVVSSVSQLSSLDKTNEVAIIAATVGQRKKSILLSEAAKLGIKVQGVKDPKAQVQEISSEMAARKKRRELISQKRKDSQKKESKKSSKKEDNAGEEMSKEDKEKEEKKKTLTKRV